MDRNRLEEGMRELPIVQYEFFDTAELTFSPRVRLVCETDCARWGTSWACPPAVGTVEECREKCLSYEEGFLFTTFSEVADIADLEQTLANARLQIEEKQYEAELTAEGIAPERIRKYGIVFRGKECLIG